ncbi:MAG: hypothetical protein RIQ93_1816, partial [Verrucomicrobiota bacterium]
MLIVAGLFALLAAMTGDFVGAITGLLVAGAGALELHGAALLNVGRLRGMNWLIGSQLFLLLTILCYCALRLFHLEIPPVPSEMEAMIEMSASQLGMSPGEYLQNLYRFVLFVVALLSIAYQGGMILYYMKRRAGVASALAEPADADIE